MEKNKKRLILASAVVVLSLNIISCNDYLDINESPNAGHIENITPAQVLPGAINELFRTQGSEEGGGRIYSMMTFGNVMMNSWATDVYNYGGIYGGEYALSSVNSSFYSGIWNRIYLYTANLKLVEDYPNTDHSQDNYVAIAKIIKAFYMQYIVDLYGDAPYQEAFLRSGNTTPEYDDDQDIYKALIAELEAANTLIDTKNSNAVIAATDPVFKGDMNKWKTFSNTIKLRMLLRMSNVSGNMAAYRDLKLADLSGSAFIKYNGSGGADENVLNNPGYSSGNNDKMNPFLTSYRVNSSGSDVSAYKYLCASEHIANCLNGNLMNSSETYYSKFNNIVDPRRFRMFSSVTYNGIPQVKGIRQGADTGQPGALLDNKNLSRLALGNFIGDKTVATISELIAAGNARGGVVMSVAESELLQAEAAIRYPSLFTNAEDHFNKAIDASCRWLGAATADVAVYKAIIATRPGLGLGVGSTGQKIEAIMTQKWLALTNINPTEMFIEYNRTGYPVTPMAVTSTQSNRPLRLFYPNSEYASNSANVPALSSADIFTKNKFTPFWNQN
ncbi:SusD/RagB family nutrient-binding outer membrane lipoprotein [Chryseobacterium sp.]|uniref:SusD/RagB family nutrient-binding outer membrane lipoprotein n=1 Tax=Chryseobacterium sp. TaxID=1871047 RepID=UPI0025C255F4|nr:SusD/RagB family nutrient-binding outer membrane lipoprotein [Chryseobacterium sp.]MBV8327974.1 SusD/RagB family nutrient-binding outer membrane lipoprotein [Chryseobacterium sp.]